MSCLAFFSVPLASARVGDYLLSKQARKTMRRLLDKLIGSQLSLRLKSVALLDAATNAILSLTSGQNHV